MCELICISNKYQNQHNEKCHMFLFYYSVFTDSLTQFDILLSVFCRILGYNRNLFSDIDILIGYIVINTVLILTMSQQDMPCLWLIWTLG